MSASRVSEEEKRYKSLQRSRDWYATNKEAHNEKRREEYKSNPKLRERAKERARQNREKAKNRNMEKARLGIKPVVRHFNGEAYKVYAAADVAMAIDRTPQVLRNWEADGWIPKPTFPGAHRYYTERQANLILELSKVITTTRYYKSRLRLKVRNSAIETTHEEWNDDK